MVTIPDSNARYRLNAKQSAKGVWQLDITVERDAIEKPHTNDPKDAGNVSTETLADTLLRIITDAEAKLHATGRPIAAGGDAS